MKKFSHSFLILLIFLLFHPTSIFAKQWRPTFGVITAVSSEAKVIAKNIKNSKVITIDNIKYTQGSINKNAIALVVGGAGIINTAVATTKLINNFHPKYLLFSGTAGAVNPTLNIGDVILVTQAYLLDLGNQNKLTPTFPGFEANPIKHEHDKALFKSDSILLSLSLLATQNLDLNAHNDSGKLTTGKIAYGKIATSSHFPNTKYDIKKMQKLNIDAVAMETGSLFKVCWLLDQKCVAVRGISNKLYLPEKNNTHTAWNKNNETLAADNAGRVTIKIIKTLISH